VFDLFGVGWDQLEQTHVEHFLERAGEEGVTWEAKGARDADDRLHPDSLRKAACGLANQIGGYLIIGASRCDGQWALNGIPKPADEPALWLGQILRGLQPVPRFEVSAPFDVGDGKVALVAKIEPVAVPPCMTSHGRIYERVSGETLPVEDPDLLDRLFRRGEHARSRAEHFALRAAARAIDLPDWSPQRSVSICVGLASVGREVDDISSRLFTEPTHEMIVKGIWELITEPRPQAVDVHPVQDSYRGIADSGGNLHFGTDGETVIGVIRSTLFVQANWDGSAAVGVWSADDLPPDLTQPEAVIAKCWRQAATIVEHLGGYGPAYLNVRVVVAKSGELVVSGDVAQIAGRPPPPGTAYARLPEVTTMGRLLDAAEPSQPVIESLGRELQRAGGMRADEPN
jgi:Putative DNA-binding domain